MSEDRADERGARAGRRVRQVAAKRRDASELAEPPGTSAFAASRPQRRENVDEPGLMLLRQSLSDREVPRERAEERRDDVQREREDDPAPDHEAERVEHAAPVGPRHQSTVAATTNATSATPACAQPERQTSAHGVTRRAPFEADPVTRAYTASSRAAIDGHAYARRRARARPPPWPRGVARRRRARRRCRRGRRDRRGRPPRRLGRQHLAIAGNVRGDAGSAHANARVSTIPKLS